MRAPAVSENKEGKGKARGWAVGSRFRPGGRLGCGLGSWADRGWGAEMASCWAELASCWAELASFFFSIFFSKVFSNRE